MKNVAVLIAIGVDAEGYREVLGVAEGTKEDAASWRNFLRSLKEQGLAGVRLFISDKCLSLLESRAEFYPEAAWQRCVVHWYRNVMTAVPQGKVREVVAMLKAIHAQEDREEAEIKAAAVIEKLETMKLARAGAVGKGLEDRAVDREKRGGEDWAVSRGWFRRPPTRHWCARSVFAQKLRTVEIRSNFHRSEVRTAP